jgi:hypothetical protein
MMLPGLGITWEWIRWLLRNLGHGIFFRPIAGLVHIFSTHPRLTPWAVCFRRFATRKIVAPFSRKGSSSDQTAAGTRCRFCGSKPVLSAELFSGRASGAGSLAVRVQISRISQRCLGVLKFGDSGFAPLPSCFATTTGAELCSACPGLRAGPTHDYSDAVDSFLPLR